MSFFLKKQPVFCYLYEIVYGPLSEDCFYFTSASKDIVRDGITYEAVTIDHDDIVVSGSLDNSSLNLKTSHKNPLVKEFTDHPPSFVVRLKIMRLMLLSKGDSPGVIHEPQTVWSGRILGCNVRGNQASFSCEMVNTSVRRPGLRRHYQHTCPHVLYDSQCRAEPLSVEGTIVEMFAPGEGGGNAQTDPDFYRYRLNISLNDPSQWPLDVFGNSIHPTKLHHGTVAWQFGGKADQRTIVSAYRNIPHNHEDPIYPDMALYVGPNITSLTKLALSSKPVGLQVGDTVIITFGCGHRLSDCDRLFNNSVNYGGQPWIPKENPVDGRINFY